MHRSLQSVHTQTHVNTVLAGGSFPSGLSFSRMMTTSQGGRAGDVNGSVASELTDASFVEKKTKDFC